MAAGADVRRLDVRTSMLAGGAPRGQTVGGAWAQARWGRAAGPWLLEVTPAARADGATLLRGATLSPRVGASLARGAVEARVAAGSAFAPPSLADQFFHEGVLVRPNPDLRPERVRGEVEGAVSVRDAALGALRVDAEAAAFRSDVDGMVLWFPDHRFVWSPSNFDVRRAGAELSARARFPWRGADAGVTASRVAVEYAGRCWAGRWPSARATPPPPTPRWSCRAGARGVRGRWVGGGAPWAGDTLNRLSASPWRTCAWPAPSRGRLGGRGHPGRGQPGRP
jgi:hypothetical protein